MPQFDTTTFSSQIFWLALVFLFLIIYIKYIFSPRLTKIINKREAQILHDLEQADALRREIEDLIRHHENLLRQTKDSAREQIAQTVAQLALRQDTLVLRLEAEIQDNIREFQQSAARQHQQIAKNIQPLIERNVNAALAALFNKS
jgi:F-type H+-transporting ATPase subunit b